MDNQKEKILISACLIGAPVRYDGQSKKEPLAFELLNYYDLIPICPETDGGLKTPRPAAELTDGRALTASGRDVTAFYHNGISLALEIVRRFDIKLAVLKERSPSCGVKSIHNGKFDGGLKDGEGLLTRALREVGVTVISEEEITNLIQTFSR